MANMVLLEGFEGRHAPIGSGGIFDSTNGTPAWNAGRWGGYCARLTNTSAYFNFASSATEIMVGCSYMSNTSNNAADFLTIMSGSGQVICYWGNNGVGTCTGGTAITIRTYPAQLLTDVWYTLETRLVYGVSGSVETRVNGVTAVSYTGNTTRSDLSGTLFDRLRLMSGSSSYPFSIDDLWVETGSGTSFRGERRVHSLTPSSDSSTGWTATGGGAHNTQVNDPLTLTTYVSSLAASGATDTYGFTDLPASTTTVDAVAIHAFARKTDAGAANLTLKSGTTDSSPVTVTQSVSTWQPVRAVFPLNDGAAWTPAGVNALTAGVVSA